MLLCDDNHHDDNYYYNYHHDNYHHDNDDFHNHHPGPQRLRLRKRTRDNAAYHAVNANDMHLPIGRNISDCLEWHGMDRQHDAGFVRRAI